MPARPLPGALDDFDSTCQSTRVSDIPSVYCSAVHGYTNVYPFGKVLQMKDAGLRIRIEKGLRHEFVAACRLQGKVAAEVLRAFMRGYVTREGGGAQTGLFEQETAKTQRPKRKKETGK